MNTPLDVYKIWAPDNAMWTEWAKPVIFQQIHTTTPPPAEPETPAQTWTPASNENAMVILDLPGNDGVTEAMRLATLGWRPVPLYNGVSPSTPGRMLVNSTAVAAMLYARTNELKSLPLSPSAPPAFMLDANRMLGGSNSVGAFDNRWCVFPQDMPSAAHLRQNGIAQVVVRTAWLQNDLLHILKRYHEQGIRIFSCDGTETKEVNIVRPSMFKSFSYRIGLLRGLHRNAAGGFGAVIPDPVESSSGGTYYRYG